MLMSLLGVAISVFQANKTDPPIICTPAHMEAIELVLIL